MQHISLCSKGQVNWGALLRQYTRSRKCDREELVALHCTYGFEAVAVNSGLVWIPGVRCGQYLVILTGAHEYCHQLGTEPSISKRAADGSGRRGKSK
eukprot:jgi/Botrbrau1/7613/Bobra.0159s0062.1